MFKVIHESRETDSQREASREYMETILEFPETSGNGDFATELQFRHEDGSISKRVVLHPTKSQAMAYASTVDMNAGSFLCRIDVTFRGEVFGTWVYQR